MNNGLSNLKLLMVVVKTMLVNSLIKSQLWTKLLSNDNSYIYETQQLLAHNHNWLAKNHLRTSTNCYLDDDLLGKKHGSMKLISGLVNDDGCV